MLKTGGISYKKTAKGEKMKNHKKEIIIGLAAGILNGLFGAGGGSVVVPAMEKFLKMPAKRAHATAVGIILLMSVVSAVIYIFRGQFSLKIWIPVTVGGAVGGFLGGFLLTKISARWLKIIFGAVIIVTAVKMIF